MEAHNVVRYIGGKPHHVIDWQPVGWGPLTRTQQIYNKMWTNAGGIIVGSALPLYYVNTCGPRLAAPEASVAAVIGGEDESDVSGDEVDDKDWHDVK
tara:strand:- start:171 stop:461 length:291 start_codon:yes stop_codon:yes gene_type:complete